MLDDHMLFINAIGPSPLDLHGRHLLYVHAASNAHAHTTEFSGVPILNCPETHRTRGVTLNTFNPRIYPIKLLKVQRSNKVSAGDGGGAPDSEPYLFLS